MFGMKREIVQNLTFRIDTYSSHPNKTHTLTAKLFCGDVGKLFFTGFRERGAQEVVCVEQPCFHMVKRHLHPSKEQQTTEMNR